MKSRAFAHRINTNLFYLNGVTASIKVGDTQPGQFGELKARGRERGIKSGMERRASRVFKRMKSSTCPVHVANYGKCMILREAEIEKDSCVKEFDALRKCFLQARKGK